MKLWMVAVVASFSAFSGAQDPWAFAGQFPQLRDMSGLPGSGFGVNLHGKPSIEGAMAISTPIGISLAGGVFDLGYASRSIDNRPRIGFPKRQAGDPKADGTAQLMVGVSTPVGNLTGTYEILSSDLDSIVNVQWQLPIHWDKGGVSLGCQNLTNRPEAAADQVPGESSLSRSLFAVATYEFAPSDFVSIGFGDTRFRGGFCNVSAMPAKRFKVTGEYDTFGFNVGVAYSLGQVPNLGDRFDANETTLWLGLIQLHRATIAVNFAF